MNEIGFISGKSTRRDVPFARLLLPLLGVALLGLALRAHDLGAKSLSYDEISAVTVARGPLPDLWPAVRALPSQAPLGFLVLRWVAGYGVEEARLRSGSVLAGVTAVGTVVWLGYELGGAAVALLAGLLLALSPLHVAVSQDVRGYGLLTALTALMIVLIWRLLRGGGSWLAAAMVAVAAVYTHYDALTTLGGAVLYAFAAAAAGRIAWRDAGRVGAVGAAALAAFAPWMSYDLRAGLNGQLIVPNVSWRLAGSLAEAFATGGAHLGSPVTSIAVALLAVVGLAWMLWTRPAAALFVLAVGFGGLGSALAMAWAAPYFFAPQQASFVLPLYLLLAAAGVAAIAAAAPGRGGSAVIWLIAVGAAVWLSVRTLPRYYAARTSDWRSAAQVVLDNIGKDDAVAAPAGRAQLLFYAPELERRLPANDWVPGVTAWVAGARQAWIVAPWQARLQPSWKTVDGFMAHEIVVDLSPSPDPAVYFLTDAIGRRATYWRAVHFELPVSVLARGTFVRDSLAELGAIPAVLHLVDRLSASKHVPLRNPALLQVLTLLKTHGQLKRARTLAARIAAREPDWAAARASVAALRPQS